MLYCIFQHYLINGTIPPLPPLRKKVIEHKVCVLIFSIILSEKFLVLRGTERDMIKIVCWSSCKVPVILVSF